MKKIIFAVALIFAVINISYADLSFTGYARNYTAMLLSRNNDFAMLQNTFNLNIEQSKDKVAFKINPYMYQYENKDLVLGLREAYMDIYFNSIDLRVGKQQIIWGKADGVFITDIISPKDLSEFILPDFDEIRIGVTGIKGDYYIGDNTLELVWLPIFTPTRMPDEESIWWKMPKFNFPVQPPIDHSKENIEPSVENSEFFVKFSALTSLVDFEIMGGYAWDDDPTMHIVKEVDSLHQLIGIKIFPEHHRLTIGGGSFSSTLGPIVLRGEGAYYKDKYFTTSNPTATEGVIKKDYLHYLIGIDYTIWDIHLSGQFIQQAILDYNDYIQNDEYTNMVTFLATRDFFNETLHLSFFLYYDLNEESSLIRPKITYDFADGFEILIGSNIFTGTTGMFGQYDNNDMIYTKIRYSF